ncbi:alpha/beta fold hydrolase [Microvirga puerhi]|uniref:Alpha/beta hydrolase n=1 Tax=Microvirga puerhi TaxID=2876078 RepID=A0ABS7VS09_9HYPH|nr:alpha/beta hydrolase [Microvirga puerhi]MBZ6078347.1 alpha/beta hydrolase [Microvirga puerhi]
MFEGFTQRQIATPEAVINLRQGGHGPAVLLLHGHPQTHVMWHRIAPRLADHYTVICADLRGYGDSSKPPTTPDHEPYSKRAMARDLVEAMHILGHERFAVVGHDRGGRCAYRMALDHPKRVAALSVLDIIPTAEHFQRTDMAFAIGYWHWFFLAQPYDLPERLIAADPEAFYLRRGRAMFHEEALAEYRRCFTNPDTIHAMCEDYRAGASIDMRLDEEDQRARRRISCPVQALWGLKNGLERWYDVLAVWKDWAHHVEGRGIDCGHYLAEEAPEETLSALEPFLAKTMRA